MLLDHHDIDDQKQMISSYDEQYNRRGAYGEHQVSKNSFLFLIRLFSFSRTYQNENGYYKKIGGYPNEVIIHWKVHRQVGD